MIKRRRFKQAAALEERLRIRAQEIRDEAKQMRPNVAREDLLRLAREAETGSNIYDWLMSPGLRSPT